MKAKEFIYNLRTNFGQLGGQLDDKTDQHIMYMLDSARAVLASQKMDAKVNVIQMAQEVDVKPIPAPKEDIGQIGDAKIIKLVIPDPIAYLNGSGIFTVGPTDGEDSFTRITYSQLRTVLHRKYTAASPKWFWLNNAIYVINADIHSQEKVRVRGIFDEPYRVEIAMGRFKKLSPFEFEYPLTMKDAKTVYQIAMASDLGWGDIAIQAIIKQQNKEKTDQQLIGALQNLRAPSTE